MTRIRPFADPDTEAVVALWRATGLLRPWNDPYRDIERKRAVQPELFLVAVDGAGTVVGSVMAGYDGHRGWLYYLASAPQQTTPAHGASTTHSATSRLTPGLRASASSPTTDACGGPRRSASFVPSRVL